MKTSYKRATLAIVAVWILLAFAAVRFAATATDRKAYALPQAAVDDFIAAIRADNPDELNEILGEGSQQLFVSEDPVADKNLREKFLRLYDEKHEITPQGEATRVLLVGTDAWPLPIPLVRSRAGWTFDTEAGINEMINRRIGRNELIALQTCLAIGDAQREYFQQDHDGDGVLEYAQAFRSSRGSKDGLFWPASGGEPQSPLGELVAKAADEGHEPVNTAFHGYRYRLLTSQGDAAKGGAYGYVVRENQIGGFAVVAYPAAYGDSGVMTLLLSHEGIVYQKDLGEHTGTTARKMKSFNPARWRKVDAKDTALIPENDD